MMDSFNASSDRRWGYRWRSSTTYIMVCITSALFSEVLQFAYIVPILRPILEDRLHTNPEDTQRLTSIVLATYGFVGLPSGIIIGQWGDRIKSRKGPLLLSLAFVIVGTILIATATRLAAIVLGRAFQSIGGTMAWAYGYATLRDSIRPEDIGKAFGLVHGCVSAGLLLGPSISGILLETTGYWFTWSVSLAVLALDIVMRLVMIEKPKEDFSREVDRETTISISSNIEGGNGERTALLSGSHTQSDNTPTGDTLSSAKTGNASQDHASQAHSSRAQFFYLIFAQPRVIVGLLSYMVFASLLSSYETTIPIYVKRTFNWGSLQAGLLFIGVQGPALVLAPLCGLVRDKVGTRVLTGFGFILLAPLLWFLGAADQTQFPWAHTEHTSKITYLLAIVGIGCTQNLLAGVGPIEITCAVDDLESEHPGIFGINGAYSRSYALSNLSYTTGLMIGPLLSGFLADYFGYYIMNSVLAVICIVMSLLAIAFLK